MAANDNTEKVIMLFEAQNKDVLRKLDGIERKQRKTFAKGAKNVKSFNLEMKKSAAVAGQLASSLAGFGGLALGGGLAGLAGGVQQVASAVAETAAEAKRAGVSFEAFQELQYVAQQNKVSVDALTDGLKEMQLRADEFVTTGKGSASEAFQRLGINAETLEKGLKKPDKLFESIIGKLEKLDKSAQIRIADEIFGGTGGEQFVQLLSQGEAGIIQARAEAKRLGLVLKNDVGAKAEQLNRQFEQLKSVIGTGLKGAVIELADAFNLLAVPDTLLQDIASVKAFFSDPSLANAEAVLGAPLTLGTHTEKDAAKVALRRKLLAGQTADFSGFNDLLDRRAKKSPSTIPSKGFAVPDEGARTKAANDAKRQAEQVQKVIDALEHENQLIGMNAQQQRVMNEIRKAGAGVTEEQKAKIEELVVANDNATQRMQSLGFVSEQAQGALMDMFSGVTSQINTGNEALDAFLQTMIKASAQAFLFGNGPMAGLFGGLGKGLFGGFFANGGNLGAGKWGIAGEAGPEIVKGPATMVPMSKMGGGGGVVITTNIDATGADKAAIARLQAGLEQRDRNLRRDVLAITGRQRARGY